MDVRLATDRLVDGHLNVQTAVDDPKTQIRNLAGLPLEQAHLLTANRDVGTPLLNDRETIGTMIDGAVAAKPVVTDVVTVDAVTGKIATTGEVVADTVLIHRPPHVVAAVDVAAMTNGIVTDGTLHQISDGPTTTVEDLPIEVETRKNLVRSSAR